MRSTLWSKSYRKVELLLESRRYGLEPWSAGTADRCFDPYEKICREPGKRALQDEVLKAWIELIDTSAGGVNVATGDVVPFRRL